MLIRPQQLVRSHRNPWFSRPGRKSGAEWLAVQNEYLSRTRPEWHMHREMVASSFYEARLRRLVDCVDDYERERRRLDEQIERRRNQIRGWEDELLAHVGHRRFRIFIEPETLTCVFNCCFLEASTAVTMGPVIDLDGTRLSAPVQKAFARIPRVRRMNTPRIPKYPRNPAADRKARALLHQMLTREQRWDLRARKAFQVTGQDGRTYEISMNDVRLIEGGKAVTSYCIHPPGDIPRYDAMLTQKLWLESNIEAFLETANARTIGALVRMWPLRRVVNGVLVDVDPNERIAAPPEIPEPVLVQPPRGERFRAAQEGTNADRLAYMQEFIEWQITGLRVGRPHILAEEIDLPPRAAEAPAAE